MDKLKQTFNENLLNEDKILHSINHKIKPKNGWFYHKTFRLSFGLMTLVILSLFISNIIQSQPDKIVKTVGITTPRNQLAYALVSVDINPSFELYVDKNDRVIEINPINEEAKTLSIDQLIGLEVQDVVEDLIKQAQDLGYINLIDTNQNTVIISTINYGIDGEKLIKNIQVKLGSSVNIDRSVKSYIIRATDDDREEAKRENVSLGIYMLNGIIQNNGVPMSVQNFVSDLNNLEILEEYAEKTNGTELVEIIQALINELVTKGIDVTSFQNRLNREGEDLEELIDDLKDQFESLNPNTNSDDKKDDEYEDDESDDDKSYEDDSEEDDDEHDD